MAYCVKADIVKAYPSADLTALTDDEGTGASVDTRIADAIIKADALIDTFLRAQHTVPLTTVDETIERLSIDLSYFFLVRRRRVHEDDPGIKQLYKESSDLLKMIADGRIKISDVTSFANTAGYIKTNKTSTSKVYTSDKMSQYCS